MWVLMLGLVSLGPAPASGQGAARPKSPREVLEAYRKMDAEGERLTVDGWYRASRFFVKPSRPPQQYVLALTNGERVTDPDPWFKGNNRAKCSVVCSGIGQIDSLGRFTSVVSPGLDMSPRLEGPQMRGPAPLVREYDLVLTDAPWELVPGREDLREVKGPPEWRIDGAPEAEPWVTIEAAIRYLTQLRGKSGDPVIKGNADKSIATLRSFLR
jgi:hypothetical protein